MSTKKPTLPDPLTSVQAAGELGCTPQLIARACASGRLAARKFGREWLIRRADLRRFRLGKPGRPRKDPQAS